MLTRIRWAGLVVLLACAGCGGRGGSGNASAPAPSAPPHTGPPFRFEVNTDGPGTLFRFSTTVPTGGWELRFDGSLSDPRIGHAIIRAVLVQPGPDEMVTQALEDLQDEYRHHRLTAKTAELHVRTVVRGATDEGEYLHARSWSAAD